MGDSVESVRDVIEVLGVETSDGDTAVHGHVDSVFFTKCVHLVLVKACESKHANLVGNVTPVVFVANCSQLVDESMTHLIHAA